MRFIDREKELKTLRNAKELSKKKLYSVAIYGLRRIGKTRLLLEFLSKDDMYFFVNKHKSSKTLLREYEDILRKRKIISKFERLETWDEFFEVIFKRFNGTVAFDEFQNFWSVDKSIFGILQRLIDQHENKKNLLLIFTGSTIGMIRRIFQDFKEPLYGRVKRELRIGEMGIKATYAMAREAGIKNIEDFIILYSIFGGFPKYYVAIEDEDLHNVDEVLERFFFEENALFEEEVPRILSMEFGKRSGVYYGILEAISRGENTPSKIGSYLHLDETSLTRQIKELREYFELIDYDKSVLSNRRILYIKHPLMNFWFRFFHRHMSEYKRRDRVFIESVKKDLNNFVGRRFEFICRKILKLVDLPFRPSIIGRHWWGGRNRGVQEIDIVAMDKNKKRALFGECKWSDNVDGNRLLEKLKRKVSYIKWKGEKEFIIFAKSFRRRPLEGLSMDLKDIEEIIMSR